MQNLFRVVCGPGDRILEGTTLINPSEDPNEDRLDFPPFSQVHYFYGDDCWEKSARMAKGLMEKGYEVECYPITIDGETVGCALYYWRK